MSTLTPPAPLLAVAPPAPPPALAPRPENRVVIDDVTWAQYVAVSDAFPERRGVRFTFDGGRLEIMTVSTEHERLKKRLGRLIELLTEELGLALETAGQMTFRREDMQRGLEPDDCFWIANEARVRGRLDYDPQRDPPPDLILEVEVSRSALNRLGIYATLRVPEVWRFDGETIRVHLLQPDQTYREADTSPTFPGIALSGLLAFLRPDAAVGYLGMVRACRAWVRSQLPATQEGRP